ADRVRRDGACAAHADLGAVGRLAAVVHAGGGDRADPRFGVARPRRAEAHLLSVDPVRPYRAPRERQRAISKERAAQGLAGGLMSRLARFVLAGGIGFVADAAVLWLLLSVTPLGPVVARLVWIRFAPCGR